MEWNSINTKDDIDKLMNVFGNFHDSCIKEVHYISGAYVNKDLEMNAINKRRNVTVVFQRQESNPSTIEVIFEKISKLNHEHSHCHNDGHHKHLHKNEIKGYHSHVHYHTEVVHSHKHTQDIHHSHSH